MKKITCASLGNENCDHVFEVENFEQLIPAAMPHWKSAHPEDMEDESKTEEDKEKWMAMAKKVVQNAPDVD